MKCMEDVRLKTVFNPPMSHIIHSFSFSSFAMILRVDVLIVNPPMSNVATSSIHFHSALPIQFLELMFSLPTLMKELWEYCLEDLRDTMEVPVGNLRCTDTSPTPNLVKTNPDVVKR